MIIFLRHVISPRRRLRDIAAAAITRFMLMIEYGRNTRVSHTLRCCLDELRYAAATLRHATRRAYFCAAAAQEIIEWRALIRHY